MGNISADCEGSGPGAKVRVRIRHWVWRMERIWLQLELGSISDVREKARLIIRFMVRCR